ncbi:MAG: hypothetical protein HY303_06530 [Candidatus Wallbacteria bacterium]|nr:hypothetical protein [Candidatus Wallbacteria bacterium]
MSRVRRRLLERRRAFILAMALVFTAILLTVGVTLLQVAASSTAAGGLATDADVSSDLARSGLADAEYQLLLDPQWAAGIATKAYGSGSYSVVATACANSVLLTATGRQAGGTTRIVRREAGLGTKALRYLLFSEARVSVNITAGRPMVGCLYSRAAPGAIVASFTGSIDSFASGGPDLRMPIFDPLQYQVLVGFDETFTGATTLTGDHRSKRVTYVNGNCTLRQTGGPFHFNTLIVNGNLTINGSTALGNSTFTPLAYDATRDLPAILVLGYHTLTTAAGTSPVSVTGVVAVGGAVTFNNLVLRGNLLALGNLTLTGNRSDLAQNRLLLDPMTYPPFFRAGAAGGYLVPLHEQVLR